jgi:hypothetical protein
MIKLRWILESCVVTIRDGWRWIKSCPMADFGLANVEPCDSSDKKFSLLDICFVF